MTCIDNKQNRSMPQCKEESNMETHLQILQEPELAAGALIMPNKEVRKIGSLSFPALANPAAIRSEIESDVTDESRPTLPFAQKCFSKLMHAILF